ncbi:MAG TPA: alpha/beta hydrolase [Verrucomicrobiae bacterium]|nr:alpha/beta hydrolase [Verrucomicrobiae bacterium]
MVAKELTVDSDGVSIAARDFGGAGTALILVHGLGGTLLDWTLVAPLLTAHHHVVALDLRDHGESADGDWSPARALADLAAVAGAIGESNPAVVGHSLGGMLAAMWGATHPQCPGVVNLDFHGRRTPDQYVGLDPATLAQQVHAYDAWLAGSLAELAGPLHAAQVDALLARHRALATRAGAEPDVLEGAVWRSLRRQGGETRLRPDPGGLGREIFAAALRVDMLELYARIECPLLVVSATAPPGEAVPQPIRELLAAYRIGLGRDLARLAEQRRRVRVVAVEASHALIVERPQAVAQAIVDFLAQPARAAGVPDPVGPAPGRGLG